MVRQTKSRKDDIDALKSRISDTTTDISDALRGARLSRQLSQQELAAKLGLRQRQISDLERGTVDARLSTILNVARALDLELMLIPRHLITAVDSLQRAGSDASKRPLYALDEEDTETTPEESHVELGETGAINSNDEVPQRKGPRS